MTSPLALGHHTGLLLPPELLQVPAEHVVQHRSACRRSEGARSSCCSFFTKLNNARHVMSHGAIAEMIVTSQRVSRHSLKPKELINSSEAVFLPVTLVIRSGGMSIFSLREEVLLTQKEFFLGCQYFNLKTTPRFLLIVLSCNYENYCNEVIRIMKIYFLLKI